MHCSLSCVTERWFWFCLCMLCYKNTGVDFGARTFFKKQAYRCLNGETNTCVMNMWSQRILKRGPKISPHISFLRFIMYIATELAVFWIYSVLWITNNWKKKSVRKDAEVILVLEITDLQSFSPCSKDQLMGELLVMGLEMWWKISDYSVSLKKCYTYGKW